MYNNDHRAESRAEGGDRAVGPKFQTAQAEKLTSPKKRKLNPRFGRSKMGKMRNQKHYQKKSRTFSA